MKPLRILVALLLVALPLATARAAAPSLPAGIPVSAAPWPSDAGKFSFAIIGDRWGGTEEEWPVFDRAVDEVNLLRPDFAILVGDSIAGYSQVPDEIAAEWSGFHAHADRLRVPLFLLPGNHDISNPVMLRWWREHIGRTYYAFDYKGCHFLVLNSHEAWRDNDSSIGTDQVKFAVEDLAQSKDAKHTFVLVHVPLWQDANNADWKQIQSAIGDRPHTLVAGHTHRLTFERVDGQRRLIVGATKGTDASPRGDTGIPEMGLFPHYTLVTVDGREISAAIVEPGGRVWPEDVAPRAFQDAVQNLVRVAPLPPGERPDGSLEAGVAVTIANKLASPVEVSVRVEPLAAEAWTSISGDLYRALVVNPGDSQSAEYRFAAPFAKVTPVPRLIVTALYSGKTLTRQERNFPLFPASSLKAIPEWRVIGPFVAGDVPKALPENPREAMPKVFVPRRVERGCDSAPFSENGETFSWRTFATESGFVNLAPLKEIPTNVLAYASCAVRSASARTVYAEFRADDYAQVFVNGEAVAGGRLFRTRSDATYLPLPLREGWNAVVVKCVNATGGWTFRLLLADPASSTQSAAMAP